MFWQWFLLAVVLWFGVHWAYVLVMAAKTALERGQLTRYWITMLAPAAVIGVLLDVTFQFTFGWLMFAETPLRGGLMFSGRVQHHYRHGHGWRRRLAQWWARNLNVFDDRHIK
jgi:D-alanyl-lipoteichoic acid acyltransferase DltB (MBOAT superfamily)